MDSTDAFVARLEQLKQELDKAGGVLTPELAVKAQSTFKEMKAAADGSMEHLKEEASAFAAGLHEEAKQLEQQAAELREQARTIGKTTPEPDLRHWEERQGLAKEEVDELVARLLASARPSGAKG